MTLLIFIMVQGRVRRLEDVHADSLAAIRAWLQRAEPFYSPLHLYMYRAKERLGFQLMYSGQYEEAMRVRCNLRKWSIKKYLGALSIGWAGL
jgi:hypothetical protein